MKESNHLNCNCSACPLNGTAIKIVQAEGPSPCDTMIVGESSGREEDDCGRPFVGASGQLLNKLLPSAGLKRDECWVTNVVHCLRGNSGVRMASGKMQRINYLYKHRITDLVRCIGPSGEITSAPITGWHRSDIADRRLIRMTYSAAKKRAGLHDTLGVVLTRDHKVLTKRGWVAAGELLSSDEVATGDPQPTDNQEQILLGSVLGDGTLHRPTACMTLCHSLDHLEYLLEKYKYLASFAGNPPVKLRKNDTKGLGRFITAARRYIQYIRDQVFVDGKKTFPENLISKLQPLAVAVWFMDDGYLRIRPTRGPCSEFAVHDFAEETQNRLAEFLSSFTGHLCSTKRGRINLGVLATKALLNRIGQLIHPAMKHKRLLGQSFTGWGTVATNNQSFYSRVITEEVPLDPHEHSVYCIDVASTGNFVTSGGVVHNCRPPDNKLTKDKKKILECCTPQLLDEIESVNPKLIILLGATAINFFFPNEKMRQCHGLIRERDGRKFALMYHPAAALHAPRTGNDLIQDFKNLPFALRGFNSGGANQQGVTQDYKVIGPGEDATDIVQEIYEDARISGKLAFDTETTSVDARTCDLLGFSVCAQLGKAYYFADFGWMYYLHERLGNSVDYIAHNMRYDYHVAKRQGIILEPFLDTMVAAYVLRDGHLGLKELSQYRLNQPMQTLEELFGKKALKDMKSLPLEKLGVYGARDSDMTIRLWHNLEPQLKVENAEKVYYDIDLPLIPVLVDMESVGINIDITRAEKLDVELGVELLHATERIWTAAGKTFNINAPAQLAEVLFERIELPIISKTPTGVASTDDEVLQELKGRHPIVSDVLRYRALSKLVSTYVHKLPELIAPDTGRIHPDWNNCSTTTGRLSCSSPNAQNIPTRTEEGAQVRELFTAPENCYIVASDYSQIEPRLSAHLSGDEGMIAAFNAGVDIYIANASRTFGVPVDKVTKQMRTIQKVLNLGMSYGMSAYGFMANVPDLKLTRSQAQRFIDNYFSAFPGVKRYIENTKTKARLLNYVESMLGRRRSIATNILDKRGQEAALREAINAPIQMSAADAIKLAMIKVYNQLEQRQLKTRLVMQVHDELVFEVPEDELGEAVEVIKECMVDVIPLSVPLPVDIEIGKNWKELYAL